MHTHLLFAWSWILVGLATGVGLGLFFADDGWLGGYASWPRRLLRLAHVACVGTGLLNLGAHWTLAQLTPAPTTELLVRALFVAGAVLMPLVCVAAAFHRRLRHAFALPVVTLAAGSATLIAATAAGV